MHSIRFFQLLHQGTIRIPVDFILVEKQEHILSNNHKLLLANYEAQLEALNQVRDKYATKGYLLAKQLVPLEQTVLQHFFTGSKPVTPLILQELTPKSLGSLLAMYEHTYFVQGVVWNVYSFDQWGIELGKTLAKTECSYEEINQLLRVSESMGCFKCF